MADGYLEKHHADYEARKAAWQQKRRFKGPRPQIERPDDEAL